MLLPNFGLFFVLSLSLRPVSEDVVDTVSSPLFSAASWLLLRLRVEWETVCVESVLNTAGDENGGSSSVSWQGGREDLESPWSGSDKLEGPFSDEKSLFAPNMLPPPPLSPERAALDANAHGSDTDMEILGASVGDTVDRPYKVPVTDCLTDIAIIVIRCNALTYESYRIYVTYHNVFMLGAKSIEI